MSRIGNPAIILIYLMTMLSVLVDRRSQCMAKTADTSSVAKTNLYSTFNDRWNATLNLGESEYYAKTTAAMNEIYDLAGKILYGQLKQEQLADDVTNGNYAEKLANEADPSRSNGVLLPIVASNAANTVADGTEKKPKLIDAQVVLSDAEQLDHRQARKTRKASRRSCPRPHRPKKKNKLKKSYSEPKIVRWQSSRPKWENKRIRPSLFPLSMPGDGHENWELPPILSESLTGQSGIAMSAVEKTENIIDDDRRLRRRSRSGKGSLASNAVSGIEMNRLAEDIGGGGERSYRHELPSNNKWQRKLQIDGSERNLRNSRSSPKNILQEHSNQLIALDNEASEPEENEVQQGRSGTTLDDYGPRINTRSIDSFPEVFSGTSIDSSSLPGVGTGIELNEAIRTANSLLTSAPSIASAATVSMPNTDNNRVSKQIQPFDMSPLEASNMGTALPPVHSDAPTANLTNVMEKVLGELESLKECKQKDKRQPEGSLCDIVGSWNSETIGLQFHISLADPSPSSRAFVEGRQIEIELTERLPPRKHDLLECDWYMTGSTVKQFGGPFYITAQKAEKYMVATFAGLCRTCGGIPTIFGSWTFVYPAKDCQDISLAVENKRDVLRKNTLEIKRKHRLDTLATKGAKKCQKCSK